MENLLFVMLAGPSQPGQNPMMSLLPLVLIIVVFYFFMIRPQMKRQKELKNFRLSLKKGDKIITTGGIYGRIAEMEEHTILVEVDNNVKLKIDKSAVLRDPSDMDIK
jgi:preprotein translocase subunit YajC